VIRRLAFATVGLAVALPAALALGQGAELEGTVGPGFNISLTRSGADVTRLAPGNYQITVNDLGDIHNFHLTGPGVDQQTSIGATERVTWQVTFVNGTYRYICDVHPTQMRGEFAVGTVSPPPPPARPRLRGSVAGSGRAALRNAAGGRVTSLKAGAYTLAVADASANENFRLSGPGTNRATGIGFRGNATWQIRLRKGTYRYRSDRHPTLGGTFRVR
jgi:hypothetical protein